VATVVLSPKDILAKPISFPTVSRDTNLPMVDWVEAYLVSHSIEVHRYYDETGDRAALFAHVGPWEAGAVVLSGHTDVVPVDDQPWTSDPFTLTERDGCYFGRSTCDMKGFDALAIWASIEAMQPVLPKGAAAIMGEPSTVKVVTAHKDGQGFRLDVWGHEVHSSISIPT